MTTSLVRGVEMTEYLKIEGMSSTRLSWLAQSPKYYDYVRRVGGIEPTSAMGFGTAFHMALLQPLAFTEKYVPEPDLAAIGGSSPRSTKAYKEAVAEIERDGRIVLRRDDIERLNLMVESVMTHPQSSKLLEAATEREVTALWEMDDRQWHGRIDAMDGVRLLADIKTTSRLKDFSPWVITRNGYYRQQALYREGLRANGVDVEHVFLVAAESVPPYDVGVFVLNSAMLDLGLAECKRLIATLDECEASGVWPGRYPNVVEAQLSDAITLDLPEEE